MDFNKERHDQFMEYWSAFNECIKKHENLFKRIEHESNYNMLLSNDSKFDYEVLIKLKGKTLIKIIYEKDGLSKFRNPSNLYVKQIVDKTEINNERKVKRTFKADRWDDVMLVLFQQILYHPGIKESSEVLDLNFSLKIKGEERKYILIEF